MANYKNKVQLIIDTDPGQDDAAALLMAFGLEKLNLVDFIGITTVAGNVPLPLTTKNAQIICDWNKQFDFPVYQGIGEPFLKKLITAEQVHGKTGLAGVTLHQPKTPLQSLNAINFLINTLTSIEEKSITLCAIGPLTNIATAFMINPQIAKDIKELIIMGGAFLQPGNVSPRSEFNFFVDPVAAAIVLRQNIQIKIISLDVTHQALLKTRHIEKLKNMKNKNGPRLAKILQSYEHFDKENFNLKGAPLHDPCAIFCAVAPEFFSFKNVHAAIEVGSPKSEGTVLIDWYDQSKSNKNVAWGTHIDAEAFFELFIRSIDQLI